MNRSVRILALLVCGGLLFSACKKKDDSSAASADSAAPADTGAAAPPAPASAAAPADTGSAAAPADTGSAAAPAAPPPGVPQPGVAATPQRPIDDCCASLAGVAARARGRRKGDRSFRAMEICPGIATLVRQGRATRSEALTQIRSSLVGYDIPSACR